MRWFDRRNSCEGKVERLVYRVSGMCRLKGAFIEKGGISIICPRMNGQA